MAITARRGARVAGPTVISPTQSYTVLRTGFLAGTHYTAGEVITLTERAAEYPLRALQLGLVTAPEPTPAPVAKAPAPAPAAPTAQATNGTSTGD